MKESGRRYEDDHTKIQRQLDEHENECMKIHRELDEDVKEKGERKDVTVSSKKVTDENNKLW